MGLIEGMAALHDTANILVNGSDLRSHLQQINSASNTPQRIDRPSETFAIYAKISLGPGEVRM